jgi:hypothetical protein
MSNASIIQSMRDACDRYEAGEILPMVLGDQLQAMAAALEGVHPRVVTQARDLADQIGMAQGELDEGSRSESRRIGLEAVAEIRRWLDELASRE